eukprot:gene11192-13030_t
MSFIKLANKYIYRPNFEEVGYGVSSYGILVVTHDPYVFSTPRWFIYITIALGIIASLYILLKVYNKTSTSTFGEPLFAPDVQIKRKWLTLLSCLSIIASGVHHIDNFLRVDQYFLPAGIYNGFFFILDVGLANWVIAAFLLTIGVAHILRNSTYYFAHTPAAVEDDVDKDNSSSHEKASLMEKRIDHENEYSSTERTDGEIEMKMNIIRRRSK